MGQLTYAKMRQFYLQGTGDSEAAQEESYDHLTEGLRKVSSQTDVPESEALDEQVTVKANTDRTLVSSIDFDAYAINDIYNVTDGVPMYPEPNGASGRRLYLIAGGLPPIGNVTHWVRDGSYIFVRYMPGSDTVLRIRGRRQSSPITMSNLNEVSPLPAQYDWPIIWSAILNFVNLHDAPTGVTAEEWLAKANKLRASIQDGMQKIEPRVEEDRTIRSTTRLRGYSTAPRSIRRM